MTDHPECEDATGGYPGSAANKQSEAMSDAAKALVDQATRRAALLHASAAWGSDEDGHLINRLLDCIEQHEAFRREVSDAVADAEFMIDTHCDEEALTLFSNRLSRFIIARPVDPLVEAWDEAWGELNDKPAKLETFRAALAARGLEIREVQS